MWKSIGHHARAIASICLFSDLADGALVVAVNPIFYGKYPWPSFIIKVADSNSGEIYSFNGT